MGKQIEELARFVAETRCADIPEPVRRHARLVLLDTLGVILAGGGRPEVAGVARAAGCDGRERRHGLCARLARPRPAHRGAAQRHRRPCDRTVRGAAAGLRSGGDAGAAGGAGGRRSRRAAPAREMLAAFILGYDVVGAARPAFTPRPLAHQNGQVSLLAAAAAGARLRGLDAAGISRAMRIATTLLLTPSYTNAVAGATALNVAGGMSGYRRRAGAGSGAGRVRGAAGRDRGGARAAGRRRLHRRRHARRTRRRAGRSPATISASTPAAIRSIRRSIACGVRWPSCAARPSRSSGSRSRPTASPRSCAIPTRRTISPRNTRCRMPRRRWSCAAAPASPNSTTRRCTIRPSPALRHRVHISEDPAMTRAGAATAAGAGHGDADRRPQRDAMPATATAAISTSRSPRRRSAPSSANWPAPC